MPLTWRLNTVKSDKVFLKALAHCECFGYSLFTEVFIIIIRFVKIMTEGSKMSIDR